MSKPSTTSKPSTYFTCRDRSDGIGAQACGIISVMVLANALDYKFVYTPMKYIAHYPYSNPSETELKLWVIAWEELLNFEDHHPHLKNTSGHRIHIKKLNIDNYFSLNENNELVSSFLEGHVYSTRETHTILSKFHDHPQIEKGWTTTLESIRHGYGRDRTDTPHFPLSGDINTNVNVKVVNICVHVRRGDSTNNQRRFVSHDYFVNVLESVTEFLQQQNRKYAIQLYSEGEREDLPEFERFNVTYRLNEDHFDTLHHMVCADVLIMSKSTFSYLPALLNTHGLVIYKPFWLFPPKPLESKWIVANDNDDDVNNIIPQSLLLQHFKVT